MHSLFQVVPQSPLALYIHTDHTSALWVEDIAVVSPAYWTAVSAAETLSHWRTAGVHWALEWAWMGPPDTAAPSQRPLRLRPDS